MKICVVLGTRPEIIKMASTIREINHRHERTIIHTGQHYDQKMSKVFFEELQLPYPDVNLEVGSGTQAEQTGNAMIRLEKVFLETTPDVILVQGDTNTVLASALAGAKLGIPIGHVESGLRSYDLRMPEEHNRRLTDHLSSYLFAPTTGAADNLCRESCWGKVVVTGNTVIDACMHYKTIAEKSSMIIEKVPFKTFSLATIHRKENVDDPAVISEFCRVFAECPIPVVLPLHPRTAVKLHELGLDKHLRSSRNVLILPPLGYFDFLTLLSKCDFVMTDSGGIQEESTSPNIVKKVFVLRTRTERPEAIKSGHSELVGTDSKFVLTRVRRFLETTDHAFGVCPYGDGRAGYRIAKFLDDIEQRTDSTFMTPNLGVTDSSET